MQDGEQLAFMRGGTFVRWSRYKYWDQVLTRYFRRLRFNIFSKNELNRSIESFYKLATAHINRRPRFKFRPVQFEAPVLLYKFGLDSPSFGARYCYINGEIRAIDLSKERPMSLLIKQYERVSARANV